MAGADAAASLRSSVSPSNLPLVSAFLACAVAQFLKPFTTWLPKLSTLSWLSAAFGFFGFRRLKDKRWDSKRTLGSGGTVGCHHHIQQLWQLLLLLLGCKMELGNLHLPLL